MSDTFDLDDNRILKLFKPEFNIIAEKESKLVKEIRKAGIPVPDVLEVIELEGRLGIVFRKVKGRPMNELVWSRPWTFSNNAKLLAKLHSQIHKVVAPELPSQREELVTRIRASPWLSLDIKKKALEKLNYLSDGNFLCHNNLHLKHIFVSEDEVTILDWGSSKRGNPIADVVKTSFSLITGQPQKNRFTQELLDVSRNRFNKLYLNQYFKHQPELRKQFQEWMVPVAASFFYKGHITKTGKHRLMEFTKILSH
jgi:aminoglycoside phosphotransferase (APT) family kinase protein